MQSKRDILRIDLSRDETAPALARRAIVPFLEGRCPATVALTVLMIGSELVTNAICHTSGGCELALRVSDENVVVEVRDNDLAVTDRSHLDGDLIGRGLGMVQSIATRWGIERHPDGGKVVWAEISLVAVDTNWGG